MPSLFSSLQEIFCIFFFFFFQAEDGIRDLYVTGVQTCALPISDGVHAANRHGRVLLRRHAAEPVDAGRHRGVEDAADLTRAPAGVGNTPLASAESRAARSDRLVADSRAAHDVPSW